MHVYTFGVENALNPMSIKKLSQKLRGEHPLEQKKLTARTVGHHTAALRFFFVKTLKRPYPLEKVPYPKAPRRLPTIQKGGTSTRKSILPA